MIIKSRSYPLKVLKQELERTAPRADGNYNANDFMLALDDAIRHMDREEDIEAGEELQAEKDSLDDDQPY